MSGLTRPLETSPRASGRWGSSAHWAMGRWGQTSAAGTREWPRGRRVAEAIAPELGAVLVES